MRSRATQRKPYYYHSKCCFLARRIPQDLSWEGLREFHARHYSPHNARFIAYGDLPLEGHLEALEPYIASSRPVEPGKGEERETKVKAALDRVFHFAVPPVPNEPRWDAPVQVDITCAPDPASPHTSTLAASYLTCDIGDTYETFVLQILGELLVGGSSAPFYRSLLESGLGSSFAPATGGMNFVDISLWLLFSSTTLFVAKSAILTLAK